MIELLSANTPNGWKISIMLEEIGFDYKIIPLKLSDGDQFKAEFKKISPFNKIPVIVDKENIDSMPEETSETLNVQKENAARWNNSTEKEQWEANVLNKLDEGKRSWILNNWAKNGFKNPKAYLSFLNKFGH